MKILILTNNASGLYCFRRELLIALLIEHKVFCCVPSEEYATKIKALGAGIIPCVVLERRGTNPVKDLKLVKFYFKVIKEIKPDVVLTYTIKPNIYGGMVCQLKKVPYIANITGLGTSIENGGLLSQLTKTLYKIGLKKAHCIFFQNRNNQEFFIQHKLVNGKTRLIPGSGVNLDNHYPEPYPPDKEGIRFLFVGRIMRDKGIGELLDAMRVIKREYPDTILEICGSFEEDYNSDFEAAGTVIHYNGSQGDMHKFYKRCHCTVLPSYHEGTANVMLESSATARPVITTRVPGCKETFDENITGFGCEAKNTASLIEAMRKFMSISQTEREKMGMAARKKMEREYDRNIVIKAYKEEVSLVERN